MMGEAAFGENIPPHVPGRRRFFLTDYRNPSQPMNTASHAIASVVAYYSQALAEAEAGKQQLVSMLKASTAPDPTRDALVAAALVVAELKLPTDAMIAALETLRREAHAYRTAPGRVDPARMARVEPARDTPRQG